MSAWTQDRVLSLAPDAGSASAGQGLASLKKWVSVGRSDRAVWGLCQGSGKSPYQTRIDLGEPAFKCSCPSRKFPCKHGLGLLLLLAKDEKPFKTEAEPGWVSEWIESRAERAEKKVEKAKETAAKPVDVEAQAKRAAQRDARVQDGVAECRVWLDDLVRRGLAAAQTEASSFWDTAAARMVDAQAPGLARLIRQVPTILTTGDGWPRRMLDRLARIHLLLRAAQRLDTLPPGLAADVRVALGRTQAKEDALAGEAVADRWCVVGQVMEEEERLRVRRTWLAGRGSGRRALLLDFAAAGQPMEAAAAAGTEFDGEVAYYPAEVPLRALVKSRSGGSPVTFAGGVGSPSVEAELAAFAQALARNPWIERWPVALSAVRPVPGQPWTVQDEEGRALSLRPGFAGAWRLLARGRGRPVSLMGEWDGEWLWPLSVWIAGAAFDDVAPRWAA